MYIALSDEELERVHGADAEQLRRLTRRQQARAVEGAQGMVHGLDNPVQVAGLCGGTNSLQVLAQVADTHCVALPIRTIPASRLAGVVACDSAIHQLITGPASWARVKITHICHICQWEIIVSTRPRQRKLIYQGCLTIRLP